MNRFIRVILAVILLSLVGVLPVGCVTAHEAHVKLDVVDNATRHTIDDCLLLSIRMESTEAQGRWWIAQDEEGSHLVPRDVLLTTVNSGEVLHQPGKIVVTVGPYVRGKTMGVEYWLFRPGYQPDDFLSDHVERSYEKQSPLTVGLLREDSGSSISDEQILDAARRVLEVANFIEPSNPDATRLLTLLIEQVKRVERNSYKPKWQKQSRELLPKLQKELQRFPRVAVVWQKVPTAPVEPPIAESAVAAASPATQPASLAETPDAEPQPVETPLEPITKTPLEEPAREYAEKPAESTDLPVAESQPVEDEEPPSPDLVPVDLSDLDSSTAESQPADTPDAAESQPADTPAEEEQDEDTVQNDLEPIHK